MKREDAVRTAFELVEKMGNNEELNKRGYKVDGWKTPTMAERADAIEKLADLLMDPEPRFVPPVSPHVHRASCHGAIGELLCGEEQTA